MRRVLLFVFITLSLVSFLPAASFGYSLAPVGQVSGHGAYGGLTASFIMSFDRNHAGDIEVAADFTPYGTFFESAKVQISTPMLLMTDHVFNALFPNPVVWSPRIGTGFQYRMGNEFNILVSVSPFAFHDWSYSFEFFSPYIVKSLVDNDWGWGMYIMKFSCFFGGGR